MATVIEGGHWPRMIVRNREQYEAWVRTYRAVDELADMLDNLQFRGLHSWHHWLDSKSGIISELELA